MTAQSSHYSLKYPHKVKTYPGVVSNPFTTYDVLQHRGDAGFHHAARSIHQLNLRDKASPAAQGAVRPCAIPARPVKVRTRANSRCPWGGVDPPWDAPPGQRAQSKKSALRDLVASWPAGRKPTVDYLAGRLPRKRRENEVGPPITEFTGIA